MTAPEIREDFSAIEAAHEAAEQRAQEQHAANIEEQLAPARSQARLDEAQAEAAILRAQGDRRLRTGGAALAGMTGVAAIIAAASLWHDVEIVHDTKVVTETKVVEVEKPVVTEKVVTVDRPVVTERVVTVDRPAAAAPVIAAAPAPAVTPATKPTPPVPETSPPIDLRPPMNDITPAPGMKLTPAEFRATPMFRTAEKCAGKLVSHINGELTFEDGSKCWDATPDGRVDPTITSTRHNGLLVVCNDTGRTFPSGKIEKQCYARRRDGTIESVRDATRGATTRNNDPFADLFDIN